MKDSIDINICYKIAFEAIIEKKEIQDVIDKIHLYTGISSFVVNSVGELITGLRDDIQEDIPKLSERIVVFFSDMDKYGRNLEDGIVCLEDCDYNLKYIPLIIKENVEAFYICIYHTEQEYKFICKIAPVVACTVSELLEKQNRNNKHQFSFLQEFISRSIFDDNANEKSLKELCKTYPEFLQPGFLIAVIRPRIYNDNIIEDVQKDLYETFRGVYCYSKRNVLYIMFTGISKKQRKSIKAFFEKSLGRYRCICGITKMFCNLEMSVGKKAVIWDILETGAQEEAEKVVFQEEEYCEKVFYAAVIEKYGEAAYKEYEFEQLEEEDTAKGTCFYNTLKEYLLCGCNVGMAAKHLYIHRNTMIYRLTKIRELLDIDINDPAIARKTLLQMLLKEIDDKNGLKG